MDWIILLVVGYVFLKICGKILRKLFSPETTALWLVALGLCFVGLSWLGLLILAWKYLMATIARGSNGGKEEVAGQSAMRASCG